MSETLRRFETGHSETGRSERGFTLLELLVTVVLMSAMAWIVLGVVADDTSQIRFEDTRNRLSAIRQAIIGNIMPGASESGMPSSFVVDNGRLPGNIDILINAPASPPTGNWGSFGSVIPVFDPTPGTDGFPDIPPLGTLPDEFPLDNPLHPEVTLMKGHRGFYLSGVSSDGSYRDGWGTDRSGVGDADIKCPSSTIPAMDDKGNDVDGINHGWCVTQYEEGLYVDSYGMDGEPLALTGSNYEQDVSMSPPVLRDDWTVDISGSKVKILNLSGANITKDLGASMLVYVNGRSSDPNAAWQRITSSIVTADIPVYDHTNSATVAEVSFPTTARIPVGEHLLVLFISDPGAPDSPNLSAITTSAVYVTARVKFFPRGGVPEMKLVIR